MAPPATPSPHRFLPGARRQTSPSSSAKPSSRLKQSTTISQDRRPAATNNSPQPLRPPLPPTASQFAPTPRFSLAKSKPPAQRPNAPTSPPRSSLAHALRPPRVGEDVEDAASPDVERDERREDDTEMLLTTEQDEVIQPSIELHDREESHSENAPASLPFSPKRRRLDSDSSPPSKPTTTNSTHPRFAPSSHNPSPSTTTSTPAQPTLRPAFLRPPTPPLANPLPQAFSPHRRGAAFVPGGTASTVQGWVIAAGQSAAASRRQQNAYPVYGMQTQTQQGGEGWGFRVRVERAEEMGRGAWRVLGCRDDSGQMVSCLLVREGKGEVRVGGWIEVRGLGWEVDVDEEGGWWVGVEWEGG